MPVASPEVETSPELSSPEASLSPTVESSPPPPPPRGKKKSEQTLATFTVVFPSLDYGNLEATGQLGAFAEEVELAIARLSGVDPAHVTVALSAGSVVVDASVLLNKGDDGEALLGAVQDGTAGVALVAASAAVAETLGVEIKELQSMSPSELSLLVVADQESAAATDDLVEVRAVFSDVPEDTSAPSPGGGDEDGGSDDIALIAGAAAGGLALVAGIAAVGVALRRRGSSASSHADHLVSVASHGASAGGHGVSFSHDAQTRSLAAMSVWGKGGDSMTLNPLMAASDGGDPGRPASGTVWADASEQHGNFDTIFGYGGNADTAINMNGGAARWTSLSE